MLLIVFFVYSALVDRPARIRAFTETEVPAEVPDMQISAQNRTETEHVVIRVLNGCGVSGVAYKLREYLLTQGFDVSETTNAEHFNYAKTIVYLHNNDVSTAERISKKLNMPSNPILDNRAPDYPCDATIVIGKDYRLLPPFIHE